LGLTTGPPDLLAGWRKGDIRASEPSVKYFFLGVLSTAMMVFGMSLLFGLTGVVGFDELAAVVGDHAAEPAMVLAVLFLFAGFGLKVSPVPSPFSAPAASDGAPSPVAASLPGN